MKLTILMLLIAFGIFMLGLKVTGDSPVSRKAPIEKSKETTEEKWLKAKSGQKIGINKISILAKSALTIQLVPETKQLIQDKQKIFHNYFYRFLFKINIKPKMQLVVL